MTSSPKIPLPKMSQSHLQMHADLLAEQSRIVARLGEITSLLCSENLPSLKSGFAPKPPVPADFDRKAYAVGIIWRNPTISARELARKVGVARSTLCLPGWADVASMLRAGQNASSKDYKDYVEDNDREEDDAP